MTEKDEPKAGSFDHISVSEFAEVNQCINEAEANRQIGLMLVDSLRELNYQVYQVQKAIRSSG